MKRKWLYPCLLDTQAADNEQGWGGSAWAQAFDHAVGTDEGSAAAWPMDRPTEKGAAGGSFQNGPLSSPGGHYLCLRKSRKERPLEHSGTQYPGQWPLGPPHLHLKAIMEMPFTLKAGFYSKQTGLTAKWQWPQPSKDPPREAEGTRGEGSPALLPGKIFELYGGLT